MNILIATMLGRWQTLHADVGRLEINKWLPFALACALIGAVALSLWLILPFGREVAWLGVPLIVSAVMVAWALWWPMNCATWLGWIGMLFRLVGVLAVSNVIWIAVAVMS